MDYHFEFTQCRKYPLSPTPTPEDLLVFYVPDREAWQSTCERLIENGIVQVTTSNPNWAKSGRTTGTLDGYRIVLQNAPCSS